MSSTGVIGNRLPIEKLVAGAKKFDITAKNGENLSKAIMTTNAYPKSCMYEVKLENGTSFRVSFVIAKRNRNDKSKSCNNALFYL